MTADVCVLIPAYRDPAIVETVTSALEHSHARVRVCVMLQDDLPGPIDALRALGADVVDMPWRRARGAGWARWLLCTMWQDEPWVYWCDAHMIFEPGWDEFFIGECEGLSTAGVLSYNPPAFDYVRDAHKQCICDIQRVGGDFGFDPWMRTVPARGETIPVRAVTMANLFAPGRTVQAVPIDHRFFFWGKESSLALRLWTHGYDLYAPAWNVSTPIVRHDWHHIRRGDSYPEHNPAAMSTQFRAPPPP